jgi:hypothetical protein
LIFKTVDCHISVLKKKKIISWIRVADEVVGMEVAFPEEDNSHGQYHDVPQETHSIHEQDINDRIVAGNDNNISTNVAHYSCASLDICHAETYIAELGQLPTGWILLDSGSTTNIISDQDLLHNIHPATDPIWISSIASCIKLTEKGHLGTYPHPVW